MLQPRNIRATNTIARSMLLATTIIFAITGWAAPCVEKAPRNQSGKRHGVHVMCQGGGAWEETTYSDGIQEGPMQSYHGNGTLRELKHYKAGKQHGPLKKYYDNGKLEEESNFIDYRKDGLSKKYEDNGVLVEESNWQAGKLHGIRKTFDERSGRLETKESYKEDKRDGTSERYGENGKPREIRNYLNGEWHGLQQKFNEHGKLEESEQYSHGVRDGWTLRYFDNSDGYYLDSASFNIKNRRSFYGTFFANGLKKEFTCYDKDEKPLSGTEMCALEVKELKKMLGSKASNFAANEEGFETEYFSNGKIRRKCAVKNSKKNGKCETFYDDGKPSRKTEYKDGTLVGESVDFWENGNPQKKQSRDQSGQLISVTEYFEDGQKKKESVIADNRETSAKEYFMNGNTSLEYKWSGDQQSLVRYHDNGKPALKANLMVSRQCFYSCWNSMEYDGLLQRFDEDGRIAEKTNYKNGKREGRAQLFWSNGKIREESEFKSDRLISEKIYSDDGTLTSETEYFADGSKRVKK